MSHVIAAIVSIFVVGFWMKLSKNTQPIFSDEKSGLIKPGKTSAIITVIVGIAMFLTCVVGVFTEDEKIVFAAISLIGLAIAGFMSPSLGNWHDLSWNENGVDGACKMFGLSLSRKRTFIKWEDINSTGMTTTQYWYIETRDQRRIYWSYLYRGHSAFLEAIRRNRPNLTLPY